MKLYYQIRADIHYITSDNELGYMLEQSMPLKGEFDLEQACDAGELARLGLTGVIEWLEECQLDNLDEAFFDCFGKALRARYPMAGDLFSNGYEIRQ